MIFVNTPPHELLFPIPFQHQPDIVLSQANPVQNQWYTLLPTTPNVRIYWIYLSVAATGETLDVRLIIDGVTYTIGGFAATAGTVYLIYLGAYGILYYSTSTVMAAYYAPLDGRSVSIEVRKTTAAGSGTITARVVYAKR